MFSNSRPRSGQNQMNREERLARPPRPEHDVDQIVLETRDPVVALHVARCQMGLSLSLLGNQHIPDGGHL
jgi:hypothetical protein